MTNNTYRIIVGSILLIALYFNFQIVVFAIIVMALTEGVTNIRVPMIVNHYRGLKTIKEQREGRPSFEAERAFRFTVSLLLLATFPLGPNSVVWFFPWFMGFAILGAGVSGICPALMLFRALGLK